MKKIKLYTIILALSYALFFPLTQASQTCFPFPKIEKEKIVHNTTYSLPGTSPWVMLVKPGLFLVCSYSNEKCPSKTKKENVWVPIGIGAHNVPEYFFYEETPCRACKTPIATEDVQEIAFFNCSYEVKGARIKNKKKFEEATTGKERKANTERFLFKKLL